MIEGVVIALTTIAGFYMAWNIGANDVANAMGTSVGSKAITIRKAIVIAGIFEFAGAFLVGAHVTNTISKGIVFPSYFKGDPNNFIIGLLSALISAGIWIQLATYMGLPVSTTHSIVGAIIGFGLVSAGIRAINLGKLITIVLSWITSPLLGGIIAFIMFKWISKKILATEDPAEMTRKYAPYLAGLVSFIIVLSIFYKGLKNLHLNLPLWKAIIIAFLFSTVLGLSIRITLKKICSLKNSRLKERLKESEEVFKILQIATASYMAFAHGANDVANATGPVAGIITTLTAGYIQAKAFVPSWILLLGGIGIVVGLATWGYKVIETVGKKITEITPSRGFSAEFGCATTVLLASKLGLPISTTHTLVGSVIGVGLARGIGALDLKVIKNIVNTWIITIPFTAGLTAIVYFILYSLL